MSAAPVRTSAIDSSFTGATSPDTRAATPTGIAARNGCSLHCLQPLSVVFGHSPGPDSYPFLGLSTHRTSTSHNRAKSPASSLIGRGASREAVWAAQLPFEPLWPIERHHCNFLLSVRRHPARWGPGDDLIAVIFEEVARALKGVVRAARVFSAVATPPAGWPFGCWA